MQSEKVVQTVQEIEDVIEQSSRELRELTEKKERAIKYNEATALALNSVPGDQINNVQILQARVNELTDALIEMSGLAADADGVGLDVDLPAEAVAA